MNKYSQVKKQNKSLKVLLVFLFIAVECLILTLGFCLSKFDKNNGETSNTQDVQTQQAVETQQTTQEPITENINAETEKKVQEIMNTMTLSDKIYQMMFVTPESLTGVSSVVRAGETTKSALEKYPVGGVVYFAYNFQNREQTIEMISNTQSYSKIPLFISVDEEGGRVARLGNNSQMGVTKIPTMKSIGETNDPNKAYEVGQTLANDLSELGFNMDFAPDADVIINENNTEIGDRSFGTDPVLVSEMVQNVVLGLEDNAVSATLKHFPGHGSTTVDSHTGYSASDRTIEQLRETEFLPFKAGIEAGVDFIMVSHMTLVNATEQKVPASISKEVITDMLIDELGYKGIIITDSFSMGAITQEYTVAEAATMAVNAGVDMILMPSNLVSTHTSLMRAVENGEITEERINESVRKILTLKVEKQMFN